MTPTVVIIEPYRDLAVALQEVVTLAHCTPVMLGNFGGLNELTRPPAAIVVRVATNLPSGSPHAGMELLSVERRPTVVALASSDADVAEANRLGCDVVLREPQQVRGLYDTLIGVAESRQGREPTNAARGPGFEADHHHSAVKLSRS